MSVIEQDGAFPPSNVGQASILLDALPLPPGTPLLPACPCCALLYADPRELAMDILRHLPEATVTGPPVLRELVRNKLRQAPDSG